MLLEALAIGKTALDIFYSISSSKATAQSNRYRASLAEENAKRADILHAYRAEKIRKEGLLDAGLFQMKAEMSGLSGVSRDMWIGQRYADMYKEVETAQNSRSDVVNRFLKENQWLRQNASNAETSGIFSAIGQGITGASQLYNVWGK